jgi:hypothetical protein
MHYGLNRKVSPLCYLVLTKILGGLQCTGGRGDPTSVKEELHWLLLMSGHVLADSGDGETPLVRFVILVG